MKLFLGADHRGYKLKAQLKEWLMEHGYEVVDMGAAKYNQDDDYVDYAQLVIKKMNSKIDRGVLICGSGHGMEIVANRYKGIRAILGFNLEVVIKGRQHEDANILTIPADWMNEKQAKEVIRVFLETKFSQEERRIRRLNKIDELLNC